MFVNGFIPEIIILLFFSTWFLYTLWPSPFPERVANVALLLSPLFPDPEYPQDWAKTSCVQRRLRFDLSGPSAEVLVWVPHEFRVSVNHWTGLKPIKEQLRLVTQLLHWTRPHQLLQIRSSVIGSLELTCSLVPCSFQEMVLLGAKISVAFILISFVSYLCARWSLGGICHKAFLSESVFWEFCNCGCV